MVVASVVVLVGAVFAALVLLAALAAVVVPAVGFHPLTIVADSDLVA